LQSLNSAALGNECWYGNALNPIATAADPATCNKACAGNLGQLCGGPDRLNLYVFGTGPDPEPEPEDPECKLVGNYDYNAIACHVRGFPVPTSDITRTMYANQEACAWFCFDFSTFCKSFSWNQQTKECTLYQEAAWTVVGDLAGSATHKDIYISDRQCFTCPPRP
jgi:hypothetical protein